MRENHLVWLIHNHIYHMLLTFPLTYKNHSCDKWSQMRWICLANSWCQFSSYHMFQLMNVYIEFQCMISDFNVHLCLSLWELIFSRVYILGVTSSRRNISALYLWHDSYTQTKLIFHGRRAMCGSTCAARELTCGRELTGRARGARVRRTRSHKFPCRFLGTRTDASLSSIRKDRN